MEEYKGMFYGETIGLKYYEGGAHFKYKDLYKELQKLSKINSVKEDNYKRFFTLGNRCYTENNNEDMENNGRSLSYNYNKQSRNNKEVKYSQTHKQQEGKCNCENEHMKNNNNNLLCLNKDNVEENNNNNNGKINDINCQQDDMCRKDMLIDKHNQKLLIKKLLNRHKRNKKCKSINKIKSTSNSIINNISITSSNANHNINKTQKSLIIHNSNNSNSNSKYTRNKPMFNLIRAVNNTKNGTNTINTINSYINNSFQLKYPSKISKLIKTNKSANKINMSNTKQTPTKHKIIYIPYNNRINVSKEKSVNYNSNSNNNNNNTSIYVKTNTLYTPHKHNTKTCNKIKMNIFTLNMRKHALSNSNKKVNKSIAFCSNKPLTKTKLNIDLNNSLGVINMATAETTKNKNSTINNNNNISTCLSSMNYNQRGLSSNNGSEISKSRNKRKVIHDIINHNNNNNINNTVNVNITSNIKTKTINDLFHNTNQTIHKSVFPISKFSPKRKLNTSSSSNTKAFIHTKPKIKKIININNNNNNTSINTITIMKRK